MAKKAYIGVDGKARKIKKGYVGVEIFVPRALPSGYTQVGYIESSKAQYIDTGFTPDQDSVIEVSVSGWSNAGSSLFGTTSGGDRYDIIITASGEYRSYYGGALVDFDSTASTKTLTTIKRVGNITYIGDVAATNAEATFTCTTTLFLFAQNSSGSPNRYATAKIHGCKIWDGNGTLVRDYVPCTNSSGTAGLYDMVNGTFTGSATSTAFVAGSSATSEARQIKKAYIGIGGVARPCWPSSAPTYYGKVGSLGEGRRRVDAANAGSYLVFGSGYKSTANSQYFDAVNASLTVTSSQYGMSSIRDGAAASAGTYALFAGGTSSTSSSRYSYTNTVQAISSSLTKSSASTGLTDKVIENAGTSLNGRAIFAGGASYDNNAEADRTVDSYDGSLTHYQLTDLSDYVQLHAAASSSTHAIFAGGEDINNTYLTTATAYNTSFTRVTMSTGLSVARINLNATGTENHVLFAGGFVSGTGNTTVVDAFDTSLTRTVLMGLSSGRRLGPKGVTTIQGFALFLGNTSVCDMYDESLTRVASVDIDAYHQEGGAGVVGNYLLMGGGYDGTGGYTNSCSTRIDAFTII